MKSRLITFFTILLTVTLGFSSPTQADTTIFIHNISSGVTTETPEGFVWTDSPKADGDLTVLSRHDGNDREIVVYDASLKTYEQITNNDLEDRDPCISGDDITWVGGEGQASEIYLASYGGGIPNNVSNNSYEDSFPLIKGNYLVWQGLVAGDWEIFLYNIATGITTQITDNDYNDISPQTDGNYVVWLGFSCSGGEIFLYDISSGVTTQITNDTNVDSPPQIADGRVVWTSHEVTDSVEPGEIILYNIATEETLQLTNNTSDDSFPRINGESVIWVGDAVEEPIEPIPPPPLSTDDSDGGGRCFIATAAFGSYMDPHVRVIKDFRDEYLLTNMPGRWFVGMYNTYGPFWADLLNAHPRCKPLVRLALMPVVGTSYFLVKTSLATKLLTGFFLMGFVVICVLRIHSRSV